MADMKVSTKGILEIAEHEGIVPAPYFDSQNILTVYIGHTKNAGGLDPAKMPRGMPADVDAAIDEAIRVFRDDVAKYEARVNKALKVPVKQHEFDALVSFDLNTGGIHRAILTKEINKGAPDAFEHFMGWLKPPEIRKRRKAEMKLFQTGNYDANGDEIPVWNVDANGELQGIRKVLHGKDLLARFSKADGAARRPKGGKGFDLSALLGLLTRIFQMFTSPKRTA